MAEWKKEVRHSHALHGNEWRKERKTTKSVKTLLGVLSRNTTPSLKIDFQAIKRNLLGVKAPASFGKVIRNPQEGLKWPWVLWD